MHPGDNWERLERLFGPEALSDQPANQQAPDEQSHRAAMVRRTHGRWLTRALRAGFSAPRIPIRQLEQGGFESLLRSSEGRAWAEEWWEQALQTPDPS